MSTISTFGTFTVARLGIYVSQKALDVTANNITNINNPKYTRQALDQESLYIGGSDRYQARWEPRVGSGAVATGVSQLRDPFLDIRYRNENASVGANEAKLAGLNELTSRLDEVTKGDDGSGVVEAQFNDLIKQMEKYVTDGAGKNTYDTLVRSSATSLVNLFHDCAEELKTLHDNQFDGLKMDLDEVNSILTRIQTLNQSIRQSDIYGAPALELRDERNYLIDELSQHVRVEVIYDEEKIDPKLSIEKLVIRIKGNGNMADEKDAAVNNVTLVDGVYVSQLAFRTVPRTNEKGEFVDDEGNTIDENGQPITAETAAKDPTPTFDIDVDPLKDMFGRIMYTEKREDFEVEGFDPTGEVRQKHADNALEKLLREKPDEYPARNPETRKRYEYKAVKSKTENIWSIMRAEKGSDEWANLGPLTIPRVTASEAEAQKELDRIITEKNLETPTAPEEELFYPTKDTEGNDIRYEVVFRDGKWIPQKVTIIPCPAIPLRDMTLYGGIQAKRELLTEQGEYATQAQLEEDPDAATKRGIPYYQKVLDTLANQFAYTLNNANRPYATPVAQGEVKEGATAQDTVFQTSDGYVQLATEKDKDGNTVLKLNLPDPDDPDAPELPEALKKLDLTLSADGTLSKEQIAAVNENFDWFTKQNADLAENGRPLASSHVLFSNTGRGNDPNGITAANISISKGWADGVTRILQSREPGITEDQSTTNENLRHILVLLQSDHNFTPNGYDLDTGTNPENADKTFFTGSFQEFFSGHINGTLATDRQSTTAILNNYSVQLQDLYVKRDSVSGVDLNDEAMNMMQFQKSYSAACRLMTTVDEMLDKLINGTGRAGL